jgi:hypothetical protein
MNKNFLTSGTIYTFKLNSGEELVAKITDMDQSSIHIEHPVSIAPGPQGMGLVPSLFTANMSKNIQLNINSVALIAETDESVAGKYIEATTGIRVPDKKIIMG